MWALVMALVPAKPMFLWCDTNHKQPELQVELKKSSFLLQTSSSNLNAMLLNVLFR